MLYNPIFRWLALVRWNKVKISRNHNCIQLLSFITFWFFYSIPLSFYNPFLSHIIYFYSQILFIYLSFSFLYLLAQIYSKTLLLNFRTNIQQFNWFEICNIYMCFLVFSLIVLREHWTTPSLSPFWHKILNKVVGVCFVLLPNHSAGSSLAGPFPWVFT